MGQFAAGGDPDHQFVGVCLGCVLQYLVLLWALVGVLLVGDDDIAVKAVLLVHTGRQGVDADKTGVPQVSGDGPLHVVVDDPQAVLLVVLHRQVQALDVVLDKVKALQGLLQRAAHLVHLGAGWRVVQGQRPGQGSGKGGLDIFSGDKVLCLGKPPQLCAPLVKAHDVRHDELVVGE